MGSGVGGGYAPLVIGNTCFFFFFLIKCPCLRFLYVPLLLYCYGIFTILLVREIQQGRFCRGLCNLL